MNAATFYQPSVFRGDNVSASKINAKEAREQTTNQSFSFESPATCYDQIFNHVLDMIYVAIRNTMKQSSTSLTFMVPYVTSIGIVDSSIIQPMLVNQLLADGYAVVAKNKSDIYISWAEHFTPEPLLISELDASPKKKKKKKSTSRTSHAPDPTTRFVSLD